jgi:hypothetical protein
MRDVLQVKFSFIFCSQVSRYEKYLKSDDLIAHHLEVLYDKMLQGNLLKIIHPFR